MKTSCLVVPSTFGLHLRAEDYTLFFPYHHCKLLFSHLLFSSFLIQKLSSAAHWCVLHTVF